MPKENEGADEIVEMIEQAKSLLDQIAARVGGSTSKPKPKEKPQVVRHDTAIDLSMPIRAFANKYARGLSGPKQFTLLVAYLAKGDATARVSLVEIEKAWSKLTGVLGNKFNPAHTTRARNNDWVNAEKTGIYNLRPSWKDALK